jgi:glutamate 5-kinase
MKNLKRLVIKIGSNVLAKSNEGLDVSRITKLTQQISALHKKGIEVILVSSGAVASGRSLIDLPEKMDVVSKRQILASVGQVKLLNIYSDLFGKEGLLCAQVLVTKEDFRDREHYLNMKNCIHALLQNNVVPVINENDVISVTELMFTDNDELAGLVSSMVDADKLLILSNIDGIYNGSPNDPSTTVIPVIEYGEKDAAEFVTTEKSNFGRGGMMTKFTMAQKVAGLGIPVQIANGKKDNILIDIADNKPTGTLFRAKKNVSGIKKWVAHSEGFTKASIVIDAGAEKALMSEKPTSLLPVGVIKIEGDFMKGDLLKICNKEGKQIGVGRAQYNSEKARLSLRKKNEKALVHYDYLFLNIE